jgi:alpha-amylase/alpha-mannosidase (GH57 family)
MTDTAPIPVFVHGHLYQPPREDPWTGETALEPTAAPYHDWNARITAECYRPNAAAKVPAADGSVVAHDNYRKLSFNVAPTLSAWLDEHDPDLLATLVEADAEQVARVGHGGAIAHPYVHAILPLCNDDDRDTLVRWGIADFVARFGRRPAGMWLPETALDLASLETLAAHDIDFTVVAPYQVVSDVRGAPVRVALPSGRAITLLPYDGTLSSAVAFGGALHDGVGLAERIVGDSSTRVTTGIVTDMETYGHHHRFGEMGLAVALDRLDEATDSVHVTNAAAVVAATAAVDGIAVAPSAWSCAHGIERWQSDCGCRLGGEAPHGQRWRAPLRTALDRLRDAVRQMPSLASSLRDPAQARDAYVAVLFDREGRHGAWDRFGSEHVVGGIGGERSARCWLELQRHLLFMYSSCGWFFDDAAGHETLIVLRHARRAIELVVELGGPDLDALVADSLAPMWSDVHGIDGRAVWYDLAVPAA